MIKNITSKSESKESKIYSYFTEKSMHDNKNIHIYMINIAWYSIFLHHHLIKI